MFKNILAENQIELLTLIQTFNKEFYLVGGTAIALQIGHRQSIDFDLFKKSSFIKKKIIDKIEKTNLAYSVIYQESNQLHLIINQVKITFFEYGFEIPAKINFDNIIKMPALLDLAAMKAYALGRRAKWKDYVDLYFILKSFYSLEQICERAIKIYNHLFSEKLFRQQICFFTDIDNSEKVNYITQPVLDTEIKDFLTEIALKPL